MKNLSFSLVTFFFFFIANSQIINIPDANFKAILLKASPGYNIASTQTPYGYGNVDTHNTIDINGDGEIQFSEANLIKYLNVYDSGITNLEGIKSFTNLQYLGCTNNQISNLNVSGLTNLENLLSGLRKH